MRACCRETPLTTDHETPWKELLEQDPERAIAFCYDDVHDDLAARRVAP